MRKIIITILTIGLIFPACKKSSLYSSTCGNVSVLIDGSSVNYNPASASLCNIGGITESNGSITTTTLTFNSFCNNGIPDYVISYSNVNGYYYTNNSCGLSPITKIYSTATCDISSIDYSNSKISEKNYRNMFFL